ncbi:MAG: hypothetical protein H0V92_03925 [Pseudonocardiales bacterium]|nr:hypothetical protein [Pseudonocardiales bacterium]
MSTIPAQDDDNFYVVVAEDGSVPAAELARLGLHPGTQLRVVPEQRTLKRQSVRGVSASTANSADIEAFVEAMAEAKAERIAHFMADVPET